MSDGSVEKTEGKNYIHDRNIRISVETQHSMRPGPRHYNKKPLYFSTLKSDILTLAHVVACNNVKL